MRKVGTVSISKNVKMDCEMFISMSAIRSDQYLMLNCGVSIFTLLPPDPKMLARFPPAAFPPTSLPRPVAGGGGGGGGRDGGGGG